MIYHKEIKKVIESFTPYFEPLSIDEFVIHLTPGEQNRISAERMGIELKKAIRDRVGDWLTCSVGIGPSRFLAKMAGERRKPDGLTVVQLKELKNFYSGLKLTDLTGINYRMEAILKNFKIESPLDFFNCSMPKLRGILNHWGRLWYFRLRGFEVDDSETKNRTIGHSHVLLPRLRSVDGAKSVIEKLIFKAGFRLRKEKYWASGVSVEVSFYGGSGFHKAGK
jgi:DNA polymerase-4